MSEPTAALLRQLRRYRRRAAVVRAGQTALTGAFAGAVIAEGLALGAWWPAHPVAVAAALGMLIAIAAAAAALTAPPLRAVAARVDERLQLQNRLGTGLQYAGDGDPYAALVVRDALAAARVRRPADAFPFTLPLSSRVLAAVACGAPLIALALGGDPRPAAWRADGAAIAGGASAPTSNTPGESGPAAPAPAAAPPQSGADPSRASAPDRPFTAGGDAEARAAAAVTAAAAASSDAGGSDAGAGPGGSAGERTIEARRSGGGGAAAAGGAADGSGGVDAGGLLDGADPLAAADPATRADGLALEWDRQGASDPERVPARLRRYVRQYLAGAREVASR